MNKVKCSEQVRDSRGWSSYQCSRNAIVERNGKPFCRQHDPEYIKQRDAERKAGLEAKQCSKCGSTPRPWWNYCPMCGTKYPPRKEV